MFQIDDDHLPRLGGGVAGDLDAAVDGLVLAIHPREALVFPENADQPAGASGEDFFHRAARFLRGFRDEFLAGAELAARTRLAQRNQHAVAIERGAGVAARDVDAVERLQVEAGGEVLRVGEVGEKERVALGVEFQGSGEGVGGFGAEQVGGFFAFVDDAFRFEGGDGLAEFRAAFDRDFEAAGEQGFGDRLGRIGAHEFENRLPQVFAKHGRSLSLGDLSRNGKGGNKNGVAASCGKE